MNYTENVKLKEFEKIDINSWDSVSKNITVNVVNSKYLEEYDNPIHEDWIDLSMTCIVHEKKNDKIISHMITEDDLKTLNVSKKQLYKMALINSRKNKRLRICPLSESFNENPLFAISKKDISMKIGFDTNDGPCIINDVNTEDEEENILACYNKNRPFGSTYIFMPYVLKEISNRFDNDNFYIIPISRHQVWYVKESYLINDCNKNPRYINIDLLDMLEEYNDTKNKKWSDVLSYNLYYCNGMNNIILINQEG